MHVYGAQYVVLTAAEETCRDVLLAGLGGWRNGDGGGVRLSKQNNIHYFLYTQLGKYMDMHVSSIISAIVVIVGIG